MPTEPKKSASQKLADEVLEISSDGTEEEVDLSGAPTLRPPVKLRPGRKAKLLRVYEHLRRINSISISGADMLEMVEEVIDALEPFAINADEFEDWVTDDNNLQKVIVLYVRYMEQMGESTRSAT